MGYSGNKGFIEFGTIITGNPNYDGKQDVGAYSEGCVYYYPDEYQRNLILSAKWFDILDTLPTINNFGWACDYADAHKFVDYDYNYIQDVLTNGGTRADEDEEPTSWDLYVDYVNSHVAWITGDVYAGRGIATVDGVGYFWVATYRHYTKGLLEKISSTRGAPVFTRIQLENCVICKWRAPGQDVALDNGRIPFWCTSKFYVIESGGIHYYPGIDVYKYSVTNLTAMLNYEQVYNYELQSSLNGAVSSSITTNISGTFPKTLLNGITEATGTTNTFYDDYELDLEDWEDETESPFGAEETNNPNADGGITTDDDFDGEFGNEATGAEGADASQFTIDAINSGFISLYNPTKSEIRSFNDYLFNGIDDNIANTLKRLVSDPLDYILSINMCHFTPPTSGTADISIGGFSSGVTSNVINKQMYKIDCGSKRVPDDFGSFLDYSGFSKVKIYLPYVGIMPLNNNEVRGGNIHVVYWIDLITGSCSCEVKVSRSRSYVYNDVYLDEKVLYTFNGNVFQQLPLTARDFKSTVTALMSISSGIASSITTGSAGGLGSIASGVMNITPDVQHSGQSAMSYGYLAEQKPFLILERPMQALPSNFGSRRGYTSNIYVSKLNDVQGYTEIEIETFKTEFFKGTEAERDELIKILSGGFII